MERRIINIKLHNILTFNLFYNYIIIIYQSSSSQVEGKVTVAFLPTMNVVSGLLQDGELTHDQSVKVLTKAKLNLVNIMSRLLNIVCSK